MKKITLVSISPEDVLSIIMDIPAPTDAELAEQELANLEDADDPNEWMYDYFSAQMQQEEEYSDDPNVCYFCGDPEIVSTEREALMGTRVPVCFPCSQHRH